MKNIFLLLLLLSRTSLLFAQTTCTNRCLNFDGKDDYVQLTKSPIQGNVNFTIEGWFRSLDKDYITTCPNGNFERIIGCGGSRFEIGECSGKFSVFIGQGGYLNSGVTSGDGKWHYFAVTKAGSAFSVFLDGDNVINYDLPTGGAFSLDNTFRIGKYAGIETTPENWQGDIDEIRVWDSALPETTLWTNRDCKLMGTEAGLKAYYNFDQGIPNTNNSAIKTLTDLSPSNNTGTLTGFALTGALSNWLCSGTPQTVACGDSSIIAPKLIAPSVGEVVQTSPKRKLRFDWSAPYGEGRNVQYKIEIFKHTVQVDAGKQYVNLVRVFADSFPNLLTSEVLVERLQPGLNKMERYSWQVTAKYGSGESPCVNGCTSIQQSFFLLAPNFDVNVQRTGSATCAQPPYITTGGILYVRYNVSIQLKNLSLGTGAGATLNFWKCGGLSTVLADKIAVQASPSSANVLPNIVSSGTLVPSAAALLGVTTMAYNAVQNISFTVDVPVGSTTLNFEAYFRSQALDLSGNPLQCYTANLAIPLPPCLCPPCHNQILISSPTPIPISLGTLNPAYDILRISPVITIFGGSPTIRVTAEVIYFDHISKCCPTGCNTQPSSHGEFVGNTTLINTPLGTGWQSSGQPMDFIDGFAGPPDFESAGVSWYSITSAGTPLSNTPFQLDIGIPKLSLATTPPCECYNLCIRYTFIDKNCKVCEVTRSYSTCAASVNYCR